MPFVQLCLAPGQNIHETAEHNHALVCPKSGSVEDIAGHNFPADNSYHSDVQVGDDVAEAIVDPVDGSKKTAHDYPME